MRRPKTKAVRIRVRRLAHGAGLPLPAYQTDGAAGLDLVAAVPEQKPLKLKRGARALVPTGLVLELPAGYEGQVRPRSGLALRHGLTLLNTPGTIDCDYRGEVQVLLVNLGAKTVAITRGERIAQLVVAPVSRASLVIAADLSATERGAGGFGSTGSKTNSRPAAAKKSTKSAAPIARRNRMLTNRRRPAARPR